MALHGGASGVLLAADAAVTGTNYSIWVAVITTFGGIAGLVAVPFITSWLRNRYSRPSSDMVTVPRNFADLYDAHIERLERECAGKDARISALEADADKRRRR